jgi:hypothetical protein
MIPSRWSVILWVAILGSAAPAAWAQQNSPHLAYVFPAGAQQGTSVKVKVGGQFLVNASNAYVSGGGIEARIVDFARPMTGMQATELRNRSQELQQQLQKGALDAAGMKEFLDIREKLAIFAASRNTSPVLAENVILQITVPAGTPPGERELRLATPQGLSNPVIFCIGQLPEFSEPPPKVIVPPLPAQAQQAGVALQPGNATRGGLTQQNSIVEAPTEITLPAIVNGQITPGFPRLPVGAPQGQQFTPGDVDRFRFQARQGQQLVIAAAARELIPYLADAVPGWFQATLALFDADGQEVAYNDDYRFHPDPVLHYTVPKDDAYTIEIKDAIYRGREDFVYRIEAGELPFVTSIFPLGGRAGAPTAVQLTGWNLPANKLTINNKGKAPGIYPVSVRKSELVSNTVPFMVDTLPEVFEKEPNNSQKNAQKVKLPIIVNGRIDQPGDKDVFSFAGRAGEQIVAEVFARRLDSPLDSALTLTDAAGKQIAFNDDYEDKGFGLETHHADSFILTTLPSNGTYFIQLRDTQQKGGPEYAYRLRISEPRPDFDLRIAPSGINAAPGETIPVTVYALRKDGFSGEIGLALKDAPRGFTLTSGMVPAGQDQVRITLTVPPTALAEPVSLGLEGRATIKGQEVTHPAVPAEDMMQAFAYRHLVPAKDLKVALARRQAFRFPVQISGSQPVKIAAGETVRLRLQYRLPPNNQLGEMQFELNEPPEGVQLKEAPAIQGGNELVLQCDAAKAKPGWKGNLIVNVFTERMIQPPNKGATPQKRRIPLGSLPAIPFEIVKR